MARKIAGSVKDDKKWFYPDVSGFQFDTRPRNVASGRNNDGMNTDESLYGGRYIEIPWNKEGGTWQDKDEHAIAKYNGWMNWMHKFELDVRFGAVSDKNAYLYQFPEIQYPWKFTEYVFQGIDDEYIVIEPPLYDPSNLTIWNGVKNPEGFVKDGPLELYRREGKLKGNKYDDTEYELVYYYVCRYSKSSKPEDIENGIWDTGPYRKQYEPDPELRKINGDLESGLVIAGKKYKPWTDPEASGCYKHTFVNTKEPCGARKRFRYKIANRGVYQQNNSDGTIEQKSTGIRLYRADIAAKCVDRGEHGNIPPYTINMAAPKDWLNPDGMYRNVVVPIVTATVGQAMYATDNGIIYYGSAMNPTIEIAVVNSWSDGGRYINGVTDPRYYLHVFSPSEGDRKVQPKPMLGSKFQKMCVGSVADGVTVGSYIHRGCAYFRGSKDAGCYCEVKRKLLEDDGKNPVDNPSDFKGIFGDVIRDGQGNVVFDPEAPAQSASACSSYSEKEGDTPAGKACKYYVEQGPKEIFTFTAEGMSSDDYAELSGYSQDVQNKKDTAMEMSGIGLGGVGAYAMSQYTMLGQFETTDNGATLSGVTTRFKVEYEFKRVDAEGRQIKSDRAGSKSSANYDQVVLGTGKFAFDKHSSGYGGVDTDIFSGTNLMSRNRFCSSVMQCYNSKFCNKAYGPLKMGSGNADTIFAGVGDEEEYCRYYTGGCPTTEVHQRAREYDREYKRLITEILKVFRAYGVDGFNNVVEKSVGEGVYAAVSSVGMASIETIGFREGGQILFLYDIGKNEANHKSANVYGFIRQYGVSKEGGKIDKNNFLKMEVETPSYMIAPNGLPWLVKLHDDYVSPSKFESYATNMLPFIGGRMPEYKDYSKMGAEILCPVTTTELGYDGQLTGGKGGDDKHNDTQSVTSYEGYRVDPTGEWIIEGEDENGDGISLGNLVPPDQSNARASLPPGIVNGARPIKGSFSKTLMSSEKNIKAVMTRAWVFSSDTRENIEATGSVMVETDDGEQKEIPIADVPEACLPTERGFYYCPKCSPHPYSWMSGEEPEFNWYGEKPIKQIFTDFEYQQYKYCPRCAVAGVETELVEGGDWRNFPKCRSYGTVNYFGLPGEIVRGNGYFWKNHTEVNRSLVSEFRSKLGEPNLGGGGPKLSKDGSANKETESAVHKYGLVDERFNPNSVKNEPKQRGSNIVVGYLTDEDYLDEDYSIPAKDSRYAMTDVKIGEETWKPKHMNDANQLDWYYDGGKQIYSEYRDRYINPYRITVGNSRNTGGLDFITANQLKYMRNMIEPVMGYPCFQETYEEIQVMKQTGYNNRKDLVRKNFHDELIGVDSFILASNDAHNDANYVQFWDGTLIPGKSVRAYYPTSPIWWFRRDYIGGIRRSGGEDSLHFNNGSSGITGGLYGYTGNLYTISFHSIQGWLPLDKEVVGAVLLCEGAVFPDEPPLGRTNAGGPLHDKHWHSITPENWVGGKEAHDESDRIAIDAIMYGDSVDEQGASQGNDFSEGEYWPVLYESEMFAGGNKVISQYVEKHFGWKTIQDFLEWKGFGEDLIQKYTEEEIWKKYTFQEFNDLVDGYTYDIGIEIGDPSEKNSVQDTITVIPKEVADGLINNEGQAIPGMFNLAGLNTSLVYNKWGMPNAEKKYNSDWAEGGQVVIQSSVKTHADDGGSGGSDGMNSGADTLNGKYAGEGKTYSWDATEYVKGYYNDRVARAFEAQGGIAYSEIWDYVKKNKVDLDKEGIIKGINNRYKDSNFDGYLLTNSFIYPKLDQNGDFPTIDDGGEYERSPMDIVDLNYCGKMYFEVTEAGEDTKPLDEKNPLYYKYSPYNLVQTNDNNEPTGGTWDVDDNGNVVFVPGSTAAICRMASYRSNELYFTVNISGFPTERERRNYRFEAGSWNVSNAVCPNTNCFVHQDNETVSEAQAASMSGNRKYMRCSFVSTSTKCGACGTSLIDKDTGAMYVGGDGIKTVYYSHMPEKDSIINGIKVNIDTSVAFENNSFKVYARSSTSTYWTLLFSVKWLARAKQWVWFEYDQDGNMVEKKGAELPNFKGKWVDGYDMSQPWILSGNHFLAYRGNKVKIVFEPETKDEYGQELPNEGRKTSYTDAVVINNSDVISSYAIKNKFTGITGIEEGSMVEIFKTRDTSVEPDWQIEIQAYDEETGKITLKSALPPLPGEPPEGQPQEHYCYRINMSKYMVTVREFKVFGFEVSDYLKMTEDADSLVIPVPSGAASVMFYDRATKILQSRVMAGDASPYCLREVGENAPVTSNQLRYFVRKDNGATKYSIVGGEFFYDTFQNVIYLPVYCCMDGDTKREVVEDIDNVYNPDIVDQTTVPSALEFRYINGAGKSIDLDITSVGEGPSYIIERDCIRCVYPDKNYDSEINKIYAKYAGKSKWGTLPSMGQSVFLKRRMGRADLEWQVTNKDRTTYKFGGWSLNGLELAGGANHAKLKEFMSGNDETNNGLDEKVNGDSSTDEVKRRLSGKSTGKITLTGLPNCIISGILCVYAPEKIVETGDYSGNRITTYERTGGLRKTGFGFFVNSLAQRNGNAGGGALACYAMSKPRMVVYLRERLLTENIT